EDVANIEKMMPKEFITDDGFGITEACRRYLLPLIEGEDYPPYKNGMPEYVTLKNKSVTKILNTDFKL
ncbi:MAG TPA: diphosphate--fructose-6-phosphate 1-phosphotransferase, partial [Gammaproteobacteria bacterium]|nr:diphosphate--fructose-6-phosphate 1-phosphotransferase [Gammaproteobacteria bacterium]